MGNLIINEAKNFFFVEEVTANPQKELRCRKKWSAFHEKRLEYGIMRSERLWSW